MTDESPQGKGRPTPKRKEAEAARKQGLAVPDSKEARKAERLRQNELRFAARNGLMRGDERYFPAKDRGPVRKAVRNYVDTRFTVGEFFVPVAFIIMLSGMIRSDASRYVSMYGLQILIIMLLVDCVFLGIRVNSVMRKEFPVKADRKGITLYAILRALQIRRFRIPPAMVKIGGRPVEPKTK
ncbi:MAG: DUF3043 domain-containing protein [Actinobacteria bacterium]|nr:DUF3043 domain-containing protein [Actinomycetota bacterium]NBY15449.1 DUF3043 domain-containing protein [Actinomycetota bacterium]